MQTRQIFITESDRKRLADLLDMAREMEYRGRDDLRALQEELSGAVIVASNKVPADVVTMNSRVRLRDLETDEVMEYTLVFPDAASVEEGRISVASPIGTAILGYTEGTSVEWKVPGGTAKIKIEKILYQPEAAGDYHL